MEHMLAVSIAGDQPAAGAPVATDDAARAAQLAQDEALAQQLQEDLLLESEQAALQLQGALPGGGLATPYEQNYPGARAGRNLRPMPMQRPHWTSDRPPPDAVSARDPEESGGARHSRTRPRAPPWHADRPSPSFMFAPTTPCEPGSVALTRGSRGAQVWLL